MKISKENGITHLDLHGVRHRDVSNEVIDFIFQYKRYSINDYLWNSNEMIELVEEALNANSIVFSMPILVLLESKNYNNYENPRYFII